MGCGILLLLAIPLGLVWLSQRARHIEPPAVVDDQENATE
jgi:hypothetical protein